MIDKNNTERKSFIFQYYQQQTDLQQPQKEEENGTKESERGKSLYAS